MGRLRIARVETPEPERLDASEIFRRHRHEIERWASRLGGPLVDCDDVVQDVMAVVHRRIADFRANAALTTWLYRITLNVATTRRRRERLRRWIRGLPTDYTDEIASCGPSAIDELERREAALQVYAALDRLDEKYRSVIILYEIEGLSGEEIAELTGKSLATVWVHLHRGRQKLRRCYERIHGREGQP
jgi:RNA polymerase sigma-70 factor (ECF subfamily)